MCPMVAKDEIRERIATELALLRDLCRALVTVARAAERDETQRPAIRDVLHQVCSAVERHFRYEEEVLAPLLREADAWGPVRVERLLEEHAAHRSTLCVLAADACEEVRTVDELANEIVEFFLRFEREVAEAEARLLEIELIGAEPRVDQIDG